MPSRLRLLDVRLSRAAQTIGLCQGNLADTADAVNTAQRRLLYCKEAGEDSWYGTWAEMNFLVDSNNPVITTPREVARIAKMTVCKKPVQIRNMFYEYLTFGNGKMPKSPPWCDCRDFLQTYQRNTVPTFFDFSGPPQEIVVTFSDPADVGKRVLLQGLDNNDVPIYSQDVLYRVDGVYNTLAVPAAATTYPDGSTALFNSITGIQKDLTQGPIQIYQQDPTTGAKVLLSTMQASETVAGYRRYFLSPTPKNCCTVSNPSNALQISAIVKLELIPVQVDTDYCLIQNLEALIEEMQSARYSTMDTAESKGLAAASHQNAVRYLNGELGHYQGIETPATNFKPFGSASLDRVNIGMI